MTKTIFIAAAEPYSGKSLITLGLINMLLGKAKKIGYFKPIINESNGKKEVHIDTVLTHFSLPVVYDDSYAFTRREVLQRIESDSQGEVLNTIISKYKKLEEHYDFTVMEGSDFVGEGTAFEFEYNILIAKNLGAPVVIVISGENKTTAQVINFAINVWRNFESREVQVLSLVINKVSPEQERDVRELLSTQLPKDIILAVIPLDKNLLSPTMKEINEQLNGRLLFGEQQLSNQVDHFVVGAMQLPHFLSYLKENVLIVTPGDRGDIIIGALQANLSASYPRVAGIVLTAGTLPEEPMMRLIEGSPTIIPIIAVETGTFETTTMVGAIQSRITPDNQ